MAAVASSSNLVELIQTLETQRNQHAEMSTAVSETLEQIRGLLGALIGGQSGPATAPAAAKVVPAAKVAKAPVAASPKAPKARAGRNRFSVTGEESVLAFIRKRGNPTTAEVQAQWSSEGRAATADNSLSKLFKDKKIKREPNKQGRGSRYTLA